MITKILIVLAGVLIWLVTVWMLEACEDARRAGVVKTDRTGGKTVETDGTDKKKTTWPNEPGYDYRWWLN